MRGVDEGYETSTAAILRRSGRLQSLATLSFIGAAIGFVATRAALSLHTLIVLLPALAVTLASIGSVIFANRRLHRPAPEERGSLRATAEGIDWNGRRIIARADFDEGVVLPDTPNGTLVRFRKSGSRRNVLEVKVRDLDEGRAILKAIGVDASSRRYETTAPSPIVTNPAIAPGIGFGIGVIAVVAAMAVRSVPSLAGALPLVLLAFMAFSLVRTKVSVGADGVFVRWMLRRRFVPHRDVTSVEQLPNGVRLHRAGDKPFDILFGSSRRVQRNTYAATLARQSRDILYERIVEARNASHAGSALDPASLARNHRSVDAWLGELRSLKQRAEGGMRAAPVMLEDLWRVLRDPRAAPSSRAGAAAALGYVLDDTEREKLRVAADAVAMPKLRVVLEAAAKRDEDKLSDALEAVSVEEERRAS